MRYCLINERLVPTEEAGISIHDRGFRYGDGIFETIAVQGGVPYQFPWHLARMAAGLEAIGIAFDTQRLPAQCRLLLDKNEVSDGLLRIQVTRGVGGRGFLPAPEASPTLVIETLPLSETPKIAVTLWQSSYAKISPRALPVRYKLCQGLNSTLARMEAATQHCFDALLLNEQGHVCETSAGNIFWQKEGALYTPALSCGVMEGSTRHALLRLSPLPVHEVEADIHALLEAEAVFITNVAWGVIAVAQLLPSPIRWNSDALARQFRLVLVQDKANSRWNNPLE